MPFENVGVRRKLYISSGAAEGDLRLPFMSWGQDKQTSGDETEKRYC